MATIFRPAVATRLWARDPQGVALRAQEAVWQNRLTNLLPGKDQFFAGAGEAPRYDWPNPRGYPFPLEDRTTVDASEVWLFGKDQFFWAPGEAPRYDWPNPLAPRRAQDYSWASNALEGTLAPAAQNPIVPGDYPVPRGAAFPLENRSYLDPSEIWLFGQDQFFGAPGQAPRYDWPNPRAAARPQDPQTWLNLLESTLGAILAAPFVPIDQSLPQGRLHPLELRSFLQSLQLQFLPAAPLPFALTDWPNPRGARFAMELRTFATSLSLELTGKDQFFSAPGEAPRYDWPNPRAATYASFLRTATFSLPPDVLVTGVVTPIYGWGARARVGSASGVDPASSIGSATAVDPNKKIGSNNA